MSQRIFDQLDRLERGARVETRPLQHAYNDSSADYSAYDGERVEDQPMVLDSFDEQLLRQPDLDSRQEQALRGNARMTLPPAARCPMQDYHVDPQPHSARLDLSQFAFEGGQHAQTSSSPFNQPLRSSPTFHASQRHPPPINSARPENPSLRRSGLSEMDLTTRYQPVSAEEIDAEIEEYGGENVNSDIVPPARPIQVGTQREKKPIPTRTGPPVVQGIDLVPTHTLPDRFRALFPYPLFNAVQSKCFNTLYGTSDNFVLSAPTGSGKTVALELAICRLINGFTIGSYKIVYQAPTKSLCSERFRDWQAKFGPLDLQCAEITGDTNNVTQRNVQSATIIITTPEKWDSITRKWKDQQKLMRMVKLFLIDEVHILKEDRGATLEAVVSRMKSVGSDVRFIALSATVPNSDDIAKWLGKASVTPHLPAPREKFGEEFRPVRLKKNVVGYRFDSNDFAFDKTLSGKLPEVIVKYSQRKPIMVFCFTRVACVETAKILSKWWATKGPEARYWSQPRKRIVVADRDLNDTLSSGVAFHHAGLTIEDRTAVEKGYLAGEIGVICCTSTLAVGVNLPCHMVIIKNTVSYQASGCKEYSDLEIMQMLGRAGRPQFDDNAVAVIMTKMQRVPHYEKMISGQEVLESCLHRNLIDHLNAEIGLGTITNASSAKRWLSGTFLYVRLRENPEHYKLEGDPSTRTLDERLENICTKGIALLEANDLISKVPNLHRTEFGDAMARYYLQFDTMKIFLALPQKAKVSEILSAVSQAVEFKDVRFRAGEKQAYKDLNKSTSIKFPLPGTLDTPAHKISLVIQSVLGGVEFPSENYNQRMDYNSTKLIVFNNVNRLIRCIIDCQLYLEDAVAARNALALARSLVAQVWDDSPLHIKQLDGIGQVFVRKLIGAGIKSVDDLENTDAHRIEAACHRNPPWGTQLIEKATAFPKLRVSIQMVGEPFVKKGEHVTVKLKAELGFLNDKVPVTFQRKPVYVCLLAETSDGRMIHFARIIAKKLDKGQDVLFSANLTSASQFIRAYVMCDEVAGTARHASLKLEIPTNSFPPAETASGRNLQRDLAAYQPNTAKRRTSTKSAKDSRDNASDEFGDAGLDDADLAQAEADVFMDIDDFDESTNTNAEPPKKKQKTLTSTQLTTAWQPTQLPNGKWACNHACKDKTQCKHLCCREGVDKKPKPPKAAQEKKTAEPQSDPRQTQLGVSVTKKSNPPTSTAVSKSIEKSAPPKSRQQTESSEVRDLEKLHNGVRSKTPKVPLLGRSKALSKPIHNGTGLDSFHRAAVTTEEDECTTDYGADPWGSADTPSVDELISPQPGSRMSPARRDTDGGSDEEMLDLGDDLPSPLGEGNGDNDMDLSPYTGENAEQAHEFHKKVEEDNLTDFFRDIPPATSTSKTKFRATGKESHLFVGHSTDSAANDLGLSQSQANHSPFEKTFIPEATKSPHKSKPSNGRTLSAQLREEAVRFNAALPAEDFMAEIDEATTKLEEESKEWKSSSSDSLKKWVMEEFGTENFRLTW